MISRKEGNVLFSDALNTFYLRLYGRKEGNVLFSDTLNTFYLWLYGRKELFYLTTHSTHLIYGYMEGRKEGIVLFNDALNTFYLRLYGMRHMVKDHSDSERGNLLLPHGLLFLISSKCSFIYTPSHREDSTYHSVCCTSRGALAGTRNGPMGPP